MKYFLGIDNGVSGAMCIVRDDGKVVAKTVMPVVEVSKSSGGTRRKYDIKGIVDWIEEYRPDFAVVEDIIAMPGQSSSSTISVGFGHGVVVGILAGKRIPYSIVRPQTWQKEIFKTVSSGGDSKQKSIAYATQMQPNESWRATERSKNNHDGLTDSFCISIYASKL